MFHLREAAEQLNAIVKDMERNRRYPEESLEVTMGHLYHHLNTAWNGRNQTDKQHRDCSDYDFKRFRKFPKEKEFIYLDMTLEEKRATAHKRRRRQRRKGSNRSR